MTPKINFKNLTFRFGGGEPILTSLSLEIPAGQITSLIGPSGSRKSSLLRCLNRLWEPPSGTVFLEDVDITTLDVLALRRRVSMLFQSAALFEGTVAANVAYGLALQGHELPAQRVENYSKWPGWRPI